MAADLVHFICQHRFSLARGDPDPDITTVFTNIHIWAAKRAAHLEEWRHADTTQWATGRLWSTISQTSANILRGHVFSHVPGPKEEKQHFIQHFQLFLKNIIHRLSWLSRHAPNNLKKSLFVFRILVCRFQILIWQSRSLKDISRSFVLISERSTLGQSGCSG